MKHGVDLYFACSPVHDEEGIDVTSAGEGDVLHEAVTNEQRPAGGFHDQADNVRK
jgi:hypothetical protein